MLRFEITQQNVNEFIPKLAAEFKIGYKCKLSEYSLLIPNSIGKGKITATNFYNGIGLYTYTCFFNKDTVLSLKNNKLDLIRLVHCLEGHVVNSSNSLELNVSIENHEYFFIVPKPEEIHEIFFPSNTEVKLCYLEIDRSRFKKSFPFRITEVEPLFYSLLRDGTKLEDNYHSGKFSLKVSDIIREVMECEETGLPRIHFLRAKSLEILSYMLSRYRKEHGGDSYENLTAKDNRAVEKLTRHISQNLKDLKTNPELARMVGMNVNKLQLAFQTIYGQTLNEFIRDNRLSRALELLKQGNHTIGEIVEEIGLNSRSYFSKIFKNKYGVLPRDILKHESSLYIQEGKTAS